MKTKRHVIVAPHADDEIIGCHSVLLKGNVRSVLFPLGANGANECKQSRKRFDFVPEEFSIESDLRAVAAKVSSDGGLIFFPDPIYDHHPEHRRIGHIGENLSRELYNVVFYNTRMNAPYICDYRNRHIKLRDLNECYPEKKSLWEYDHKYFLFEGYNIWSLPTVLL